MMIAMLTLYPAVALGARFVGASGDFYQLSWKGIGDNQKSDGDGGDDDSAKTIASSQEVLEIVEKNDSEVEPALGRAPLTAFVDAERAAPVYRTNVDVVTLPSSTSHHTTRSSSPNIRFQNMQ